MFHGGTQQPVNSYFEIKIKNKSGVREREKWAHIWSGSEPSHRWTVLLGGLFEAWMTKRGGIERKKLLGSILFIVYLFIL